MLAESRFVYVAVHFVSLRDSRDTIWFFHNKLKDGLPGREPTRKTFSKDLVERVLERRKDPTVKFADPHFYIQQPATIPDNIATTPRPDKDQSIAEHVSRFKT